MSGEVAFALLLPACPGLAAVLGDDESGVDRGQRERERERERAGVRGARKGHNSGR